VTSLLLHKVQIDNVIIICLFLGNNYIALFAVGSDQSTRVWNLQTGELLKTVASPYPLSYNCFPTVCFSESFGQAALPGLILGIKNELHFYSL